MITIAKIEWFQELNNCYPCSTCEGIIYSTYAWRMWLNSPGVEMPTSVIICEDCHVEIEIAKL